MHNILNS